MKKGKIYLPIILCLYIIAGCTQNPPILTPDKTPFLPPSPSFTDIPATSTATITDTPIPTITYEPPSIFDLSNIDKIPPDNIINEIAYLSIGGDATCPGEKYKTPYITYHPLGGELMNFNSFIACGWEKDENITTIIRYPDGKENTKKLVAAGGDGIYYARLDFKPSLNDPAGEYVFVMKGKSGQVQSSATFYKPMGARIYQTDDNHILLYGFKPVEKVKIFYYRNQRFAGWQEYRVDVQGALTINFIIANENLYDQRLFVALGEKSGEVRTLESDPYKGANNWVRTISIRKSLCKGRESRFTVGLRAKTAFADGSNVRIRAKPGFAQDILGTLPTGTIVYITQGPKCAGGSVWWFIVTESGLKGWIAETYNKVILLEAYP